MIFMAEKSKVGTILLIGGGIALLLVFKDKIASALGLGEAGGIGGGGGSSGQEYPTSSEQTTSQLPLAQENYSLEKSISPKYSEISKLSGLPIYAQSMSELQRRISNLPQLNVSYYDTSRATTQALSQLNAGYYTTIEGIPIQIYKGGGIASVSPLEATKLPSDLETKFKGLALPDKLVPYKTTTLATNAKTSPSLPDMSKTKSSQIQKTADVISGGSIGLDVGASAAGLAGAGLAGSLGVGAGAGLIGAAAVKYSQLPKTTQKEVIKETTLATLPFGGFSPVGIVLGVGQFLATTLTSGKAKSMITSTTSLINKKTEKKETKKTTKK